MGLQNDQEGIMRRYIDEGGAWDAHLNATKKFIVGCLRDAKPKCVGILGSGWLLDVPVEFLLKHIGEIFLYDIRHPKQVVNRYKNHKQIHFINQDITGGAIAYVYSAIRNGSLRKSLGKLVVPGFKPNEKLDYWVSLNILNQLDILIVENLRRLKYVDRELIMGFREKIQHSHIQSLPKGKSCIVTDYKENVYDRGGSFIESHDLLYTELPPGIKEEKWVWHFDTQMTYYPNKKTYFEVIAKQF